MVFLFSHCGGFRSVEKLDRIETPKLPEELEEQLTVEKLSKKKVAQKIKAKAPKAKIRKVLSVFELPAANARKAALSKVNPFRVGEKTTMAIKWFAIKAGEITLEVLPYVSVIGRKAYHFRATARSSSVMDLIHSVDDSIESYVDTETFYPFKSAVHGVETDRLREGLVLFDYAKKKIHYWMKRVHTKKPIKEKRRVDNFIPGVMDVFTGAFYLRTLPLEVGQSYSANLYNEGKRILVKGEVLRREVLDTDLGDFNTLVIRPEARFEGILKTSGDSLIWVTDDNRRFILKIQTRIKIGYLNLNIRKIEDSKYDFRARIDDPD